MWKNLEICFEKWTNKKKSLTVWNQGKKSKTQENIDDEGLLQFCSGRTPVLIKVRNV